jgi:ribonuclease H2 subunit C
LVEESMRAGVEVEGIRVEEAFFRGRKLQGATISLPDGYRGVFLALV